MPMAEHAHDAPGAGTQPTAKSDPEPKRRRVEDDADGGEQATATQADGVTPGADGLPTPTDAMQDDGGEQPLSDGKADRQQRRKQEKKRRQRQKKKALLQHKADELHGEQDATVARPGAEHTSLTTPCSSSAHPLVVALQQAFPHALPWVIERQVKNCQALYVTWDGAGRLEEEAEYVSDYLHCCQVDEDRFMCDLPAWLALNSPFSPLLPEEEEANHLGIEHLPRLQTHTT